MRVGGDVDFWLWEPDGRDWSPFQGTRTPNGLFSADSWESDPHAYYEAWLSSQVVEVGKYLLYAHQWTAPQGHTTVLDVAYRFNSTQDFSFLYRDNPDGYVLLDQSSRIEDDSSPTLGEADIGSYSNFKHVSVWTPGGGEASPALAARNDGLSMSPGLLPNTSDMEQLVEMIQQQSRMPTARSSESPQTIRVHPMLPPPPIAR